MKRYYFQQWRQAAGLSQDQLAKLVGKSKTQISRIENGERDFTGDFLADFQKAVGCHAVGDPLNAPPPFMNIATVPKLSNEDIEARLFERAQEIRKALRAQKDMPKLPPGHRRKRKPK